MIDIHCHILPGVDDGARTIEESIEMARLALAQGINTIVASPHHLNNQFENVLVNILTQVDELNQVLEKENIPINIIPGQEVRIHGDLLDGLLEFKEVLPVNLKTPYILIELPTSTVPKYTKKLLYDLQLEGYIPIIVHPERNSELLETPEKLYELVKNGVLTQITAGSLVGKFGKKIKKFSHEMIESNLTHVIASDAHNTNRRGFNLQEALQVVEEGYGIEKKNDFLRNAEKIIDGESVVGEIPEKIKKNIFWRIIKF
jgi:protein-tyrosine phosphatase